MIWLFCEEFGFTEAWPTLSPASSVWFLALVDYPYLGHFLCGGNWLMVCLFCPGVYSDEAVQGTALTSHVKALVHMEC